MADTKLLRANAPKQKMAPDFTLPDVNGEPITLSKVLGEGRRAMVVFLRHLG